MQNINIVCIYIKYIIYENKTDPDSLVKQHTFNSANEVIEVSLVSSTTYSSIRNQRAR